MIRSFRIPFGCFTFARRTKSVALGFATHRLPVQTKETERRNESCPHRLPGPVEEGSKELGMKSALHTDSRPQSKEAERQNRRLHLMLQAKLISKDASLLLPS